MVQHPWFFILILFAGLLAALLPQSRNKNGNPPRTEKKN